MFRLEDLLSKEKPPPQIFDLVNTNVESEPELKALIEKIPDYNIKPDTVSNIKEFPNFRYF